MKVIDRLFYIEYVFVFFQFFLGEMDFRFREVMVIKEKNICDEIILVGVGGEGKGNYVE